MGSPLNQARLFRGRGKLDGLTGKQSRQGAAFWVEETTGQEETARAEARRHETASALGQPSNSFVSRQGSEKREKTGSIPHSRIGLKEFGNMNLSK